MENGKTEKIKIETDYIKLEQLLKWAGIADSGSYAKVIIKDGVVKVNGEIELQRGRKIRTGDIVEVEDIKLIVEL